MTPLFYCFLLATVVKIASNSKFFFGFYFIKFLILFTKTAYSQPILTQIPRGTGTDETLGLLPDFLRRFPLNVRAISVEIKLPKKYS